MLDLHSDVARLDHQVDPLVGHTDGLPGVNPQLRKSIDK